MTLSLPSRYHVGRELGRGGMGIVYEADDERLGRKVAVKVLHVGPASDDRKRRFAQEARAASALNHPNIITIYDIDAEAGVDFIVMELVDGMPLTRAGRDVPLPIDQAIDYAIQIAGALAASHAANIVHRDLKPANIMVTDAGRIKVLDFGLSKWTAVAPPEAMTATASPATRAGIIVGTSGYMSPEQALGQPVDARSDVFSLGVVLYELMAGRRAFTGDTELAVTHAVVHEQPKPLHEIRPDVPDALVRIVGRCLDKDRLKRYPSAVELLDDLQRFSSATASAPPRRSATLRVLAGATAILLLAALAAAWIAVRRSQSAAVVEQSLPEIERLAAMGQYVDAYRVAQRAARAAPGDPRVRRALVAMTAPFAMDEPAGADVYFKDYLDVDGPWQLFGRVPIKNERFPIAQLRWRMVKDGFEPSEGSSAVGPQFMIRRIGEAPPGMVHVRGGRSRAGPATVVLPDFWIDKFEVTNREFKRFVDAGGYRDPKYWAESFAADNAGRRFEETVARFTDKTGRPGPATWELGAFPEGQADYPVGGVSWYEAAAYAAFAEKKLPTVFHWKQATGNVLFGQVVAAMGNFNGRSAEPPARLKDLGAFGTYGLAGNVREWIWNAVDDRRSLVGGAWSDPPYMAANREPRSPLDREESDGFRCIRDVASPPAEALAPVPTYIGAARSDKPVGDSAYATYKALYTYDRRPLDPRVESTNDADRWRTERVTIAAAYGRDRVPINIYLPKNSAPPYQAVVWFPGGYALGMVPSSRDLDDMPGASHFSFLPRSGRALVFPIYQGTFERFGGVGEAPREDQMNAYREMVTQWSKDFGRTIDYLETRSDIDASKVGYYSLSMGANGALPIVAMESRVKAAVLVSGGLPAIQRPPEADPINFAGHITVPTLMISGRNDFIFPLESTARPLFALLGAPPDRKRLVIHDGGHMPPLNDLIRDVLGWFDEYLGPVRAK